MKNTTTPCSAPASAQGLEALGPAVHRDGAQEEMYTYSATFDVSEKQTAPGPYGRHPTPKIHVAK